MMATLLLHRSSGDITIEAGRAEEHALDHAFDVTPAILCGDGYVKLLRNGDWVATAQPASSELVTFVLARQSGTPTAQFRCGGPECDYGPRRDTC